MVLSVGSGAGRSWQVEHSGEGSDGDAAEEEEEEGEEESSDEGISLQQGGGPRGSAEKGTKEGRLSIVKFSLTVRNAASSGGNGAVEASINDGDGWDGVISMMLASCIS